jgi:hypothetical protein
MCLSGECTMVAITVGAEVQSWAEGSGAACLRDGHCRSASQAALYQACRQLQYSFSATAPQCRCSRLRRRRPRGHPRMHQLASAGRNVSVSRSPIRKLLSTCMPS